MSVNKQTLTLNKEISCDDYNYQDHSIIQANVEEIKSAITSIDIPKTHLKLVYSGDRTRFGLVFSTFTLFIWCQNNLKLATVIG